MALKKYSIFLNGKRVYTKKLKSADTGKTFHHTVERDFIPDALPKETIHEFDVVVPAGEIPPPPPPPPPIECPPGQHLENGVCVPDVVTPPPPPPPPPPPTGNIFKIGHCGDTHGDHKAVEMMVTRDKVNFVLHSGDASDDEQTDDGYVETVQKLGLVYGTSVANSQGNHESAEEGGEEAQADFEAAFPILKQTNWLQFYHVQNVCIIINNTQISGYSQLDSVASKHVMDSLTKAKGLVDSGAADWIFFMQHKPMYTLKGGHDSEYNFRYNHHAAMDAAGVDIWVSGHVHNEQRTKPLIFGGPGTNVPPKTNDAMKDGAHDFTVTPHGIICCQNGSSTKSHSLGEDLNAWTAWAEDNGDSYTVFEINGKNLTGKFIDIDSGEVRHEFRITKGGTTTPPPPPPPTGGAKVLTHPITSQETRTVIPIQMQYPDGTWSEPVKYNFDTGASWPTDVAPEMLEKFGYGPDGVGADSSQRKEQASKIKIAGLEGEYDIPVMVQDKSHYDLFRQQPPPTRYPLLRIRDILTKVSMAFYSDKTILRLRDQPIPELDSPNKITLPDFQARDGTPTSGWQWLRVKFVNPSDPTKNLEDWFGLNTGDVRLILKKESVTDALGIPVVASDDECNFDGKCTLEFIEASAPVTLQNETVEARKESCRFARGGTPRNLGGGVVFLKKYTMVMWDLHRALIPVGSTIPPPPPPPPTGGGEVDSFGMKMLYKPTGKKVAMEEGSDHENGKRYNVNHSFHNYIMQGYFKLGQGQEKINMKGDGPNHGGCTEIGKFQCLWYEMDIQISNGKFMLQYEMPHPDNTDVPDSKCEHVETIGALQEGQWIGWATAYYWGADGFRHMKAFVDKNPFDAQGKPLNNWVEGLHAIEKGQIVEGIKIPRDMQVVIDHEAGLEAEIRMHGGTQGDTEMKNVWVFEIEKPTS